MTEPRNALEQEFGGPLSPGLAALRDSDLAALAKAIVSARTRQERALTEATEQGLNVVPRVLRGTVRKVLFG
jgi:hypothetical protein